MSNNFFSSISSALKNKGGRNYFMESYGKSPKMNAFSDAMRKPYAMKSYSDFASPMQSMNQLSSGVIPTKTPPATTAPKFSGSAVIPSSKAVIKPSQVAGQTGAGQAGASKSSYQSGLSELLKSVLGMGSSMGGDGGKPKGWIKKDGILVPYYSNEDMKRASEEARTRSEYKKMESARLDPIKASMEASLADNAKNSARRTAALNQALAKRGVVDTTGSTGTQGDEAIAEASRDEERITQSIRDSAAVMMSDVSADVKQKMLAQLTADRAAAEEAAQNRIDTFLKTAGMGAEIYGMMYNEEKDQLDRALAEKQITQEQYDSEQNRLIDWYNARTSRMGAETAASKAAGDGTEGAKFSDPQEQISFLKTTINQALGKAGASGPSAISKWAGDLFVGDTDFRNLETLSNTLKTNLMALMGDPNVRKFFGPQMSNSDVRLMQSLSSTLDPENRGKAEIEQELNRIMDLIERMEVSMGGGNDPLGIL